MGNRSISLLIRSRVFSLIRKEQWSPEEVSGRLKLMEDIKVSKSTIYNWIAKCSPHFKDSIHKHLRHNGKRKKKNKQQKLLIHNRVSIEERPEDANGSKIGDWEMDIIVGKNGKGAILTLVARKSGYLLMEKLKQGKRAKPLARVAVRLLKGSSLPINSITTDNGTEFAEHQYIAKELGTTVYFAHPYSSREKGTILSSKAIEQSLLCVRCCEN